ISYRDWSSDVCSSDLVQPAPAAVALQLVGAVGDALQFLQDEPRHNHLAVDVARITDIGNPAVDDDTGVQRQRLLALDLLGELDRSEERRVGKGGESRY